VASHVAPAGVGDSRDPYHRGFAAYRWLLGRLRPPLWLHGHTNLASIVDWRIDTGRSIVANVTGSILVEVHPPPARAGSVTRPRRESPGAAERRG
jgi:hypothetical protein